MSLKPVVLWESNSTSVTFPMRDSSFHVQMRSNKFPGCNELWNEGKLFVIAFRKRATTDTYVVKKD